MADTYRAWMRGDGKWQDISVIDLRTLDGTGKRLQSAGLKTLGEIEPMSGVDLLKLPGMGVGVVKRARQIIKTCKATDRRKRRVSPRRTEQPPLLIEPIVPRPPAGDGASPGDAGEGPRVLKWPTTP
jgi:hypothetical protein